MIAVPSCLADLAARGRPRRRSPRPAARPTAAASGRARRGSGCRSGRPGRRCRPAASGLAVAEQHVLEVRRAGLRRADVEEDLVAHRRLLQQQLERQARGPSAAAADPASTGSTRVRVPLDRVASAQQPLPQPEGGVLDPVAVLRRYDGRRAGGPRQPGPQRRRRAARPAASGSTCRLSAAPTWRASSAAWAGTSGTASRRRTPTSRGQRGQVEHHARPGRCAAGRGTARRPRAGRPGAAAVGGPAPGPGSPASSARRRRTRPRPRCAPASWRGRCRARAPRGPPPPGGRPSATSASVYAAASHGSPASW